LVALCYDIDTNALVIGRSSRTERGHVILALGGLGPGCAHSHCILGLSRRVESVSAATAIPSSKEHKKIIVIIQILINVDTIARVRGSVSTPAVGVYGGSGAGCGRE
jgi:hypothetical protein